MSEISMMLGALFADEVDQHELLFLASVPMADSFDLLLTHWC